VTIATGIEDGTGAKRASRAPVLVLWLVTLVLLGLSATRTWRFVHDDAFIVMRYADNFLHGDGPVWNPGERVEGYTSPLWLVQLTLLGAIGIPLRYGAQLLGLGWLLCWCASHLHGLAGRARATAWLVATLGSAVVWAFGALETASTGALVAASILAHRRTVRGLASPWPMAVFLGLLALTRPEGVLFVAPILGERVLARDRRSVLAIGLATAAPVAAWELFRWGYYGAFVPNTAHVKIPTNLDGLLYFVQYMRRSLPLWLPSLVLVVALRPSKRTFREFAPWLVAGGLYFGYLAFVGGDSMPWGRTLVPLLAIATMLSGFAVEQDTGDRTEAKNRSWRSALVGAGALTQLAVLFTSPPQFEDGSARTGTYVGIFLESVLPRESLVALNSAGATPYYAPSLRFLDMLGLNDAHIARVPAPPLVTELQRLPGHRLGDGPYVLSRNPDVVILGPAHGDTSAWFYGDQQLLQSELFRSTYALAVVDLDFAELRPRAVRPVPRWDGIPGDTSAQLSFFVRRGSPSEEAIRRLAEGGRTD
jgi:hypothetical protein